MSSYEFYTYAPWVVEYDDDEIEFDEGYDPAEDQFRIVVSDDDGTMDASGDGTQTATVFDMDGNVVATGPVSAPAYAVLEDEDSGETIVIDRIEVGGQHFGYVSDKPLIPDCEYEVQSTGTRSNPHSYYQAHSFPCFGPGTRIACRTGWIPVEAIQPADEVLTRDHGYRPVLWVGQTAHTFVELRFRPAAQPREIPVAAFGPGRPVRPLCVTGDHRILLESGGLSLLFGTDEAFVPAKSFVPIAKAGVGVAHSVVWHHILFDRHEIICAEGLWSESLFTGPETMARVSRQARADITAALGKDPMTMRTARPCLTVSMAQMLFAATLRAA